MSIWTGRFWKDATERVIFTAAEVLLGLVVADNANVLSLNWEATGAVVLTASVAAFLKAIVANKAVDNTISPASLAQ